MNVEDIVMTWADDYRLNIEWGYDPEDSPRQHFFFVEGNLSSSAISDLEYVLSHVNYFVDMAYETKDGRVLVEIAPY